MSTSISRREFSVIAAGALAMAALPLSACAQVDSGDNAQQEQNANQATNEEASVNILFINSSRNKDGNTAHMGQDLLEGLDYEQLDLIDHKIHPLGQDASDDQFSEVWAKMLAADTIVFGTPVYWHSMASSLKILIDRMYDFRDGSLAGKQCAFFCQGGGPTELSLENLTYTFERVADYYEMTMIGTATSSSEVSSLRSQIDAALG